MLTVAPGYHEHRQLPGPRYHWYDLVLLRKPLGIGDSLADWVSRRLRSESRTADKWTQYEVSRPLLSIGTAWLAGKRTAGKEQMSQCGTTRGFHLIATSTSQSADLSSSPPLSSCLGNAVIRLSWDWFIFKSSSNVLCVAGLEDRCSPSVTRMRPMVRCGLPAYCGLRHHLVMRALWDSLTGCPTGPGDWIECGIRRVTHGGADAVKDSQRQRRIKADG